MRSLSINLSTFEDDISFDAPGPIAAWFQTRAQNQTTNFDTHTNTNTDTGTFAREYLNFAAEPAQLDFLASSAKRGIGNCSRQCGKSTIGAAKAVHRAWTRPNSLILILSPTKRQSALLLAKARAMAAFLLTAKAPGKKRSRVKIKKDPDHELSLLFPNGSQIVGIPAREGNIRGFSAVSMIIIDEAARVPDAAYRAVRPMLAVGNGDLWLLSTPMGKRGFFYEEFANGGDRWTRFEIPATACAPRISPEFLEEELADMGPSWVKQEYFCVFVDMGQMVFDCQLVEDSVTDEIPPLAISAGAGGAK